MVLNAIMSIDKDIWLQERRSGIGASESAAIFGVHPYKSPYALWADKTGHSKRSDFTSEAAEWGNELEPVVASKYARVTGRELVDHGRFKIFRSATHPYMTATLDREIKPVDGTTTNFGVLEVKTAAASKETEWSEGEQPISYQVQIQHQMFVTGAQWGSFAVLIGGQKFRWYDIKRNDEFISLLVAKCEAFWGLVERKGAPSVDGHRATLDALKGMFPSENGEAVAMPPESLDWAEDMAAADALLKVAYDKKNSAAAKLQQAIGNASHTT